ncbi:MAG TPA: VOC family protein [Gaiellaceae bacterium]|nr:VOC family protein [Gaiellaceae bacterium]
MAEIVLEHLTKRAGARPSRRATGPPRRAAPPRRPPPAAARGAGRRSSRAGRRHRPKGGACPGRPSRPLALEASSAENRQRGRHVGLVVDDREEALRRAREAGAVMVGDNDFFDPWGNRWQVVAYRDVQFTKAPRVLAGMGLDGLGKSERALAELRAKGLAD